MYTTHGLMIGGDYAEYLKDTDQGSTVIDLDNVPEWFETEGVNCPVCDKALELHDSVTIVDASGEIFACSIDGESHTIPESYDEQ